MKVAKKQMLRKKKILETILPLMDESGIENMTVQEICKTANLSVGSFYHYFPSKESIYEELIKQMDAYFVNQKEIIFQSESALEQLERFMLCYKDFVLSWGYVCNRAIVRYSLNRDSTFFYDESRPFYELLKKIIKDGVLKSQIRHDFDEKEIETMVLTLMRGYTFAWVREPEEQAVFSAYELNVASLVQFLDANRQVFLY